MSYGYPMGDQAFTGQGWQQQQQPPPPPQGGYQGLRSGHPPPPHSQHYGSYGQQTTQNAFSINAWQAMQFNQESDLESTFRSKCSPAFGAIQAQELMEIMNQTPRIRDYYRINWSMELCKIMLAMLDRNKDGMMQYPEFQELLQCLVYWHQTFSQYDMNRSGYIEAQELGKCIREKLGYSLSVKAMECVLKRYARAMDNSTLLIAFDDFVALCVRLRAYTEAFRARDRSMNGHETGSYTFNYDDFLQCTMCL